VDRLTDHMGLCGIGRQAVVASYLAHFGEENCLRGWNGSGTIFFSGCNLRCVFCQNHDISRQVQGERVTPARLAEMMLELQHQGCHNINWVTPEHVVPQILEAVPVAVAGAAAADHLQHQRPRQPGQPAADGRGRRHPHA
jgi:putative pyruvate formate lyase activating enzyme